MPFAPPSSEWMVGVAADNADAAAAPAPAPGDRGVPLSGGGAAAVRAVGATVGAAMRPTDWRMPSCRRSIRSYLVVAGQGRAG
jgi:hypothetical protein